MNETRLAGRASSIDEVAASTEVAATTPNGTATEEDEEERAPALDCDAVTCKDSCQCATA